MRKLFNPSEIKVLYPLEEELYGSEVRVSLSSN